MKTICKCLCHAGHHVGHLQSFCDGCVQEPLVVKQEPTLKTATVLQAMTKAQILDWLMNIDAREFDKMRMLVNQCAAGDDVHSELWLGLENFLDCVADIAQDVYGLKG